MFQINPTNLHCSWSCEAQGACAAGSARGTYIRPERGGHCEITLPPIQLHDINGIVLTCNARICEVYSRAAQEITPSYVSTVRGKEGEGAKSSVFSLTYSSKGALQPGSTLTLRMLSLKPSPSFFCLHSAAWLRQQNPLSSPQLGAPLQARCEAARASCTKSGGYSPDASLTQGQQGGAQDLGGKQRLTQHAQRVSESRGAPWGGGLAMEGEGEGGGSQMDDIRDLLRTVAQQGGVPAGAGGDPKHALLAAIARSALAGTLARPTTLAHPPRPPAPFLGWSPPDTHAGVTSDPCCTPPAMSSPNPARAPAGPPPHPSLTLDPPSSVPSSADSGTSPDGGVQGAEGAGSDTLPAPLLNPLLPLSREQVPASSGVEGRVAEAGTGVSASRAGPAAGGLPQALLLMLQQAQQAHSFRPKPGAQSWGVQAVQPPAVQPLAVHFPVDGGKGAAEGAGAAVELPVASALHPAGPLSQAIAAMRAGLHVEMLPMGDSERSGVGAGLQPGLSPPPSPAVAPQPTDAAGGLQEWVAAELHAMEWRLEQRLDDRMSALEARLMALLPRHGIPSCQLSSSSNN